MSVKFQHISLSILPAFQHTNLPVTTRSGVLLNLSSSLPLPRLSLSDHGNNTLIARRPAAESSVIISSDLEQAIIWENSSVIEGDRRQIVVAGNVQ